MVFQKVWLVSGISVWGKVRGYDPEAVYDNVLVREGFEPERVTNERRNIRNR